MCGGGMRRRAAERLPVTIDSGVTSSFCLGCLVTRASIELATWKIRSSRAVRCLKTPVGVRNA